MGQKIALVEDEQAIAEAIILNLELESYEVIHISHGRKALDEIQVLADSDLVILDVMLPEVNGIDICKELRERSNVPVLFLSAKGTSTIQNIEQIDRGYERIDERLRAIGANIVRV